MKKSIILITILGFCATGSMLSGCGSNNTDTENTNTQVEQQHNQDSSQQTGASGGHSGEGNAHAEEVNLNKQQRQSLGINIETLNAGSAASTIARPVSIHYNLDNIAKVGPRVEAKMIRVLKDLGDRIGRGEPLALMSSVALGKAKAEYIRLKARLKTEQARYKREQSLYDQKISSEAELLEAEAAFEEAQATLDASAEALRLYGLSDADIKNIQSGTTQPLSRFYINSPIAGVVQERNVSPGQTVPSSETPIHVANLSEMWVMIDAYEQDIRYIKQGQTVDISIRSMPDESFKGTVNWISYALEEGSRTMPVRAVVSNANHQLRAGMFGTARIQTGQERDIAVIPVDAIQTIEGESKVFIPGDKEGRFQPVRVQLGAENEGLVEIISGLQPGDQAVTVGAFDLKSALTAQTRSASHGH